MSDTLYFKAFCFESYKNSHGLNGRETIDIFTKYKVFDYLSACYDVLHTTGKEYIIEDIDIYIDKRRKLAQYL